MNCPDCDNEFKKQDYETDILMQLGLCHKCTMEVIDQDSMANEELGDDLDKLFEDLKYGTNK